VNAFRHPARHAGSRRGDFRRILQSAVGARSARLPARTPDRLRGAGRGRGCGASRRGGRFRRRTSLSNAPTIVPRRHRGSGGVPFAKRGNGPAASRCTHAKRAAPAPSARRGATGPCPCGGPGSAPASGAARRTSAGPPSPPGDPGPGARQVERFRAREARVERTFRTMAWEGDALLLLDQRVLPVLESMRRCADPSSVADAIRTMVVRAPGDRRVRAFGLVLAVRSRGRKGGLAERRSTRRRPSLREPGRRRSTSSGRSTGCAVRPLRCRTIPPQLFSLLEKRRCPVREDVAANRAMGAHGAKLLPARGAFSPTATRAPSPAGTGRRSGDTFRHRCGKRIHVYVDETRPFLQGSG